ncbi:galactokinase [Neolewinella lacunae]|uniref:Galactokinase n=1 Tax=Neolewinella lacunae TaxID=1517758 RepID=A0A923PL35_9BACT|nr:galactokinase [Neolewinella lacunae]MBC6996062.1 galactokinase [Neolewinella lacunae]MDN3636818.1 galactokinase [Neolewinella lacunae]
MLPHLAAYFASRQLDASSFPYRLFSPGRINLIGEHTDYTGGYVMPAAIDKGIYFYARPIAEPVLRLYAADLQENAVLDLPVRGKSGQLWADYLAGIVDQFQQLGYVVPGLEIIFGGDVPRGSGMSSSAALEGGMAFLLNAVVEAELSRPALAQLAQRSSNTFIGVPTGIMDQFASLNGSAQGPILLQCATLDFHPINATLPGYSWLLVNSLVTHELGSSQYPIRVAECARALAALQSIYPGLDNLSAATLPQLDAVADTLDAVAFRRAYYVISENARVHRMAQALAEGEVARAGTLLNATHAGLRDDYAVSCEEIDFLHYQATEVFQGGHVAGARIMGGGFGGCTINLVRTSDVPALQAFLAEAYQDAYHITPEFYPVQIGPGTRWMSECVSTKYCAANE